KVEDTKKIWNDFRKFTSKLKRRYGSVEYIRVLEPHEDGHAHLHVLLKFVDYKKMYIPNKDLANIWGNGFVTVHSLKNIDNIGAYVSAYLADVELTEKTGHDEMFNSKETEIIEKGDKKYIKGGRLKYYPTGTN